MLLTFGASTGRVRALNMTGPALDDPSSPPHRMRCNSAAGAILQQFVWHVAAAKRPGCTSADCRRSRRIQKPSFAPVGSSSRGSSSASAPARNARRSVPDRTSAAEAPDIHSWYTASVATMA